MSPALTLRPLVEADLDALVDLDSDPEVMRHINGGQPTTRRTYELGLLERFLAPRRADERLGFWAVEEHGRFVGWAHLRPDPFEPAWLEVGYRLRRDAWGRGIATAATRALIDHGLRHFPGRGLSGRTLHANAASHPWVLEHLPVGPW